MSSQTPTSATPDAPKLLKKASTTDVKAADTQTIFACQHTKGLLTSARSRAIEGYGRAIAVLRTPSNISYQFHKDGPDGVPACTVGPTFLCLQCPHVSKSREKHRKDHGFAVDSTKGFLWCHECRDFVYDQAFEEIRAPNRRKRKHAETEDDAEKKLLAVNTTAASCAATGLRGFYNMGQTCFMSVILQSLINNPIVKEYYLDEHHKSSECERECCTSCALDDIVADFYATDKHEGYGAVHMLQACWKNSGSLAGYQQQDAHEFFGFIVNSLHEADIEDPDKVDASDCDCMIHQIFSGTMRSTVTCTSCKSTNTTPESFVDLSLEVKHGGFNVKKKKLALTGVTQTVKEPIPVELTDCLDRFTSTETLSSDSYHCRKCDAAKEAKKTLSLTHLPPTIAIHLKRFSHSKANSQSTKVDGRVRFPFKLDFEPYLANKSGEGEMTNGHRQDEADGDSIEVRTPKKSGEETLGRALSTVYELSSVVVHKGKIDNGHYISYARREKEWFRFDDEKVILVDEKEVLGAEAYMLYYVISQVG